MEIGRKSLSLRLKNDFFMYHDSYQKDTWRGKKLKIKNLFNLYVRKKHNAYLNPMCISKYIFPTLVRGLYLDKVQFASQFRLGFDNYPPKWQKFGFFFFIFFVILCPAFAYVSTIAILCNNSMNKSWRH
jgi:hypothetical protein